MVSSLMLLSNPFRPDPRVLQETRALVQAGVRVGIIAWDRDTGRNSETEVSSGVRVIRTGPRCPFRSPVKVLTRLPRFWLRALSLARNERFDLVHSHDMDTLPAGMLIARLHGKPLLYDAHELYAKMIENEAGPLSKLVWALEKALSRRADELVTVGQAMADELSKRRRKPARIVTTSPDPSVVVGIDRADVRKKWGMQGFVVSYLGSLEPGRFVEELVTAFPDRSEVNVIVAGSGTLAPVVEKASGSGTNVRFIGTVDTDEALRITWASDVVVAMMDPKDPINRVGTPGKVINAMALGRPVIVTEGVDIAGRVRKAGCGIVVPYDKAAFAAAVERAAKDPKGLEELGRKGREHYDRELSWTRSRDELLTAYRALAGPNS